MKLQNRMRLTDLESELMVAREKGQLGVWEGHVHTAILKQNWMGGELGGELIYIYVCIAGSLRCSPKTSAWILAI